MKAKERTGTPCRRPRNLFVAANSLSSSLARCLAGSSITRIIKSESLVQNFIFIEAKTTPSVRQLVLECANAARAIYASRTSEAVHSPFAMRATISEARQ